MVINANFEYISDNAIDKYVKDCGLDVQFIKPELPRRATTISAGYDIITPMDITLEPEEELVIPTFLKVFMPEGWFLAIYPKSGLGWKYYTRIANTTGIIDGDYYNNVGNEGHILVKLRNEGDKTLFIPAGKAFVQSIFQPYGVCEYEPTPTKVRAGGFGSTNS